MPPKGRVLLVGGDQALVNELTPSMVGREYELAVAPDARQAGVKIATEAFSAVVLDLARVPVPDREIMIKLQKERGGFALIGLEASPSLSPAVAGPMRRLPWPLPQRFLDQVRAVELPVVFLVDPTLYVTQGIQNALRLAGIQFFQLDAELGLIEMMRAQMEKLDEARSRSKPSPNSTFWGRLTGGETRDDAPAGFLGHVAVVKFSGAVPEAAQADGHVRQALPNAVCYLVTTLDPARIALSAVKNGQPAVLPRDNAARLAEILADASNEAGKSSAPRERERLLLVDNDMPSLQRLSSALIALGYEVAATVNGEEALNAVSQKFAEHKPFHLAAIGGPAFESTRLLGANLALKMRERDKDLCIVLMIDQHPPLEALKGVSRAIELGLDDAIIKPIGTDRLALSVRRALENRFLKTENVRLLKEVQESARKLAQVNGFQTKFFATVAHDVKNPLTAILGYSEVLGMRLREKPEELKCAAHIHNAAKTLNLLVSDLVDLAAIESGKLRVEIGQLDLAAVALEVKSRVDVVAQRKQLAFTASIPPNLPMLAGDPHRIGQVIQNLCTNAVQYTKEGGRITIEVNPQPGWIIVGVRDTGIGISKEDLPRVWERFFQTKEAQTMRKAGFGLGLKIAREIVQMHGGDMGIESELGVGSFFFFKLPIPKPGALPSASAAAPPAAAPPPAAAAPAPAPVTRPAPAAPAAPAPAPITGPAPAPPASAPLLPPIAGLPAATPGNPPANPPRPAPATQPPTSPPWLPPKA